MNGSGKAGVSEHYQNERGASYVQSRQADASHYGYELDFDYFRPYLRTRDSVLDFGCGNGGMLRLLDGCVELAEGLEVNPSAAEKARKAGAKVYSSLRELPEESVYDAVISNHVLEHIRDVPTTLEVLRRNMKPGGLLLLKLPIDDWRTKEQRSWSKHDIDHHLQTWTPRLMGNMLSECGYEVENIRIITSAWHPKMFPLRRLGLHSLACWALAIMKRRRQLFVVARTPTT